MKKIVLVIIILLLTGCTADYNLEINGDNFVEEIKINLLSDIEKQYFISKKTISLSKYDIVNDKNNVNIYDYSLENNIAKFVGKHDLYGINNSNAIYGCYDKVFIYEKNNNLILSTGLKMKCFDSFNYLTDINVNITVNDEVISSNADYVAGSTYSWKINKNNVKDKTINMIIKNNNIVENNKLDKLDGKEDNYSSKKENAKNSIIYYGIYLLILILFLLIFMFGKKLKASDNLTN